MMLRNVTEPEFYWNLDGDVREAEVDMLRQAVAITRRDTGLNVQLTDYGKTTELGKRMGIHLHGTASEMALVRNKLAPVIDQEVQMDEMPCSAGFVTAKECPDPYRELFGTGHA
jgi:hypothetical protein